MQFVSTASHLARRKDLGEMVLFDRNDDVDLNITTLNDLNQVLTKCRGLVGDGFINGVVGQNGSYYYCTNFRNNLGGTVSNKLGNPTLVPTAGSTTISADAFSSYNAICALVPYSVRNVSVILRTPEFGKLVAYQNNGDSYVSGAIFTTGQQSAFTCYSGLSGIYQNYVYGNGSVTLSIPNVDSMICMATSTGHSATGYGGRFASRPSNCLSFFQAQIVPDTEKVLITDAISYVPNFGLIKFSDEEIVVNNSVGEIIPGTKPSFYINNYTVTNL